MQNRKVIMLVGGILRGILGLMDGNKLMEIGIIFILMDIWHMIQQLMDAI